MLFKLSTAEENRPLEMAAVVFVLFEFRNPWQFLFLLSVPLFVRNLQAVRHKTAAASLDPYLKQMALSTLLFVILFGIGHLLA